MKKRQKNAEMRKRLAITAVGAALIIFGAAEHVRSKPEAECIEYVVSEGDTLWEIAEEIYGSNADIRKAVEEIRNINGCGGEIFPGDVIKVPERSF